MPRAAGAGATAKFTAGQGAGRQPPPVRRPRCIRKQAS